MGLLDAARGLMALFGTAGPDAERGALLLGAVLLAHRPELPEMIVDLEGEGG